MTHLQTLTPQARDLGGGFTVRRLLPQAHVRAVGPFVFFDHFGPLDVAPGANHDVRPHPHIGLATVTYLFEGAIVHRDSTGVVQRIEPGAVNWMSAGRGIVHSERTPKALVDKPHRTHGLQMWVALPDAMEDSAPSFQHVDAAEIPERVVPGATVRVVVGDAFGAGSPVRAASPTVCLVAALDVATEVAFVVPGGLAKERALYALDHPIEVDGVLVDEFHLAVLAPDCDVAVSAPRGGRVVVVGGEPLGPRHVVWNFVSSTPERIRAAEDDWRAQRFPKVPGETEFIPLPERPAPVPDSGSVPGAA